MKVVVRLIYVVFFIFPALRAFWQREEHAGRDNKSCFNDLPGKLSEAD